MNFPFEHKVISKEIDRHSSKHAQTFICEIFVLAMIKRINVFDPLIAEMLVRNNPMFN